MKKVFVGFTLTGLLLFITVTIVNATTSPAAMTKVTIVRYDDNTITVYGTVLYRHASRVNVIAESETMQQSCSDLELEHVNSTKIFSCNMSFPVGDIIVTDIEVYSSTIGDVSTYTINNDISTEFYVTLGTIRTNIPIAELLDVKIYLPLITSR